MKKTAITLLLIVAGGGVGANAQTMYDALRFSENNYEGTARTIAMGNAFTALGGDPGAVTINPAGSAVARYSQVTITPGITWSINMAQGTKLPESNTPNGFERAMKNTSTSFFLPNVGISLNFDMHRSSGLKNISVGFISNAENTFIDGMYAKGTNSVTSFAGALAAEAFGYTPDALNGDNAYNNLPWGAVLGYQAGLIGDIADSDPTEYVGTTENIYKESGNIAVGGPLDQTFARSIKGIRYNWVVNLAANISDMVYLGANVGATSMNFSSEEIMTETAADPDLFQTGFSSLKYRNTYKASGLGIYGKFGVIVTPFGGLRIGAAIQTPTLTTVKETWGADASSKYAESRYDSNAQTPEGNYEYRLTSPFRVNAGIAYAFGKFAVISADYEMCDYKGMFFRETGTIDNSGFDDVNTDIRDFMGVSHMLRAGIEVKPVQFLALRAGYGLTTSPEKDQDGKYSEAKTNKYSFGLGFNTKGSFYADLAFACRKCSDEYIYPYNDYIDGVFSPEILNRKAIWTAALTLGFRF